MDGSSCTGKRVGGGNLIIKLLGHGAVVYQIDDD